jgi:hypothetical protein
VRRRPDELLGRQDGSVVAHGAHRVEIRDGAAVLYGGDVYFGEDATKTITLDSAPK